MLKLIFISILLCSCAPKADKMSLKEIKSAEWIEQSYGEKRSVRGIYTYSENICWLAGSRGTYSYTEDGGKTWNTDSVPGATKLEFRDIHVFDENTVIALTIGPGDNSRIYKTADKGKTWSIVFQNKNEKAFFDAFEFWDENRGFTMSDAVDGKILIYTTEDAGESWNEVNPDNIPPALENEGSFAASGTNVMTYGNGQGWIGGSAHPSRVYLTEDYGQNWTVYDTPIQSDSASAGIFSIAFNDNQNGIAVGGNYSEKNNSDRCVIITNDGGKTWRLPNNPNTLEFRSCVRFVPGTNIAFATGRSGSNYSTDFGETWTQFSDKTYYTMSFAPNSTVAYAAGPNGHLAKLKIEFK